MMCSIWSAEMTTSVFFIAILSQYQTLLLKNATFHHFLHYSIQRMNCHTLTLHHWPDLTGSLVCDCPLSQMVCVYSGGCMSYGIQMWIPYVIWLHSPCVSRCIEYGAKQWGSVQYKVPSQMRPLPPKQWSMMTYTAVSIWLWPDAGLMLARYHL